MRKVQGYLSPWVTVFLWMSISVAQEKTTVLIAYYSQGGHTRAMAEAVARGARLVGNVDVKLLTTAETTSKDLLSADAVIVGSPVYSANPAPEVLSFINGWPWEGAPMRDKIGAVFVTGGEMSAGEELTQVSILHAMMICGMIIVGGAEWSSAFGASAVTGEKPFEEAAVGKNVAEQFLKKGEALGKRVAELTVMWKRNR